MEKDEIKNKLIELEVENMKYVISIIPRIKEIINNFNGKVFNVKLERALQEIDKGLAIEISSSINTSRLYFTYYVHNNDCVKTESNNFRYIKNHKFYLINTDIEEIADISVGSKPRISSEKMNKKLDEIADLYNKKIEYIHIFMDNFDCFLTDFNKIVESYNSLINIVPSVVSDYYEKLYSKLYI